MVTCIARRDMNIVYHTLQHKSTYLRDTTLGSKILEGILDLLKKYKVTKQEIFDLQLVATMLSNNVTRLYTYNKDDFIKFKEIEVLSP